MWLSVFLTDEHADCAHEALTSMGADRLPKSQKRFTGSADTNPLNPVMRSGRVAIIERPLDEVIQSSLDAFDNPFDGMPFEPFVAGLAKAYKVGLDRFTGVERWQFSQLADPVEACRLANYLRPGTTACPDRAALMVGTVIRTDNRDLKRSVVLSAMYFRLTVDEFYRQVVSGRLPQ